jgi:xanthosine utilization system XapX-like protein
MDLYVLMFWTGVFVLLVSHILLFRSMPQHSTIALTGLALMFVGSKLGREFLGIA